MSFESEIKGSNFKYAKDQLDVTMKYIYNMYSKHPNENGMSGLEHFGFALKLGGMTLVSGLLLIIHAFAPWWFTTTGGDLLLYSSDTLKNHRHCMVHESINEIEENENDGEENENDGEENENDDDGEDNDCECEDNDDDCEGEGECDEKEE